MKTVIAIAIIFKLRGEIIIQWPINRTPSMMDMRRKKKITHEFLLLHNGHQGKLIGNQEHALSNQISHHGSGQEAEKMKKALKNPP